MNDDKIYTRSVALASLPEFIKKRGAEPKLLFDKAGLDIRALDNAQSFISWPKSCDVLEIAAQALELPNLGILWALETPNDFSNTGPSIYLANLMPDVMSLMDMVLKYQKVHTNGIEYSYSLNPQNGTVTGYINFHPATPACRQFAEHITAIIRLGVSQLIGPPFDNPLGVKFQHSAPDDLTSHQSLFGCPIAFNANCTEMTYALKALDKEMTLRWKFMKPLLISI